MNISELWTALANICKSLLLVFTTANQEYAIKIYTNGSGLSDRAGSGIYIENRGERSSFCHRNPDFSSVFKGELIAIEHGFEAVLNEQDFVDLWIISDSCSSVQHLYNWITVGDKAGVSILQNFTQILESHNVHFQWIPSHVNIFGNEQADLLAKEGCNASPPVSSTLTYSEHQSRVKSEILKEWWTPPSHHWNESKHAGPSFLLKCGRASQTAISRLKSGHIKSLSFCGGRKTFALCIKCKTQQASPDHILNCLGLSREDLFSSSFLILDFLRINDLLGIV
ncbi:RNase H domain-containing protein [Trichonephila clavipes]|uniref:RNase H domain-containing protein n=1 Tax=Trichonephila clavipes TaxID=2585209 RepID=A0A8X6V9Q9_TRICX|nr:RNase H domain-containing protein [Trichonephila clavipes]